MIIVTLLAGGGLGNQLFQYALARRLADANHSRVGLDLSELRNRNLSPDFVYRDYDLDLFNLRAWVLTDDEVRRCAQHGSYQQVGEQTPHRFDPTVLARHGRIWLRGNWEVPRYFEAIAPALRTDLTLRDPLPPAVQALARQLATTNSVCVNVRRQGFVDHPVLSVKHGFVGLDYYHRALATLTARSGQPDGIYVISDDPRWCYGHLDLGPRMTILEHTPWAGPRFSHYLMLMASCRHFIIPNSTFAWWAAWLGVHPAKQVIAPQQWFKQPPRATPDLCPPGWVRV